jgi:hypothetical protein
MWVENWLLFAKRMGSIEEAYVALKLFKVENFGFQKFITSVFDLSREEFYKNFIAKMFYKNGL